MPKAYPRNYGYPKTKQLSLSLHAMTRPTAFSPIPCLPAPQTPMYLRWCPCARRSLRVRHLHQRTLVSQVLPRPALLDLILHLSPHTPIQSPRPAPAKNPCRSINSPETNNTKSTTTRPPRGCWRSSKVREAKSTSTETTMFTEMK